MVERSGDKPPCIVKIFSSMMAAIGRQLKQSVKVFHSLMLYLRLPIISAIKVGWTFVVESVDPVDACTLMVPSQNEEVLWVFDFISQKKAYSL
jgi:hypothetical protein